MRARATAAAAKAELELVRERLATDTKRAELAAAQHAAQAAHAGVEHRLMGKAWAAASVAAAGFMPTAATRVDDMLRRGVPSPEAVFAAAAAHAAATTGHADPLLSEDAVSADAVADAATRAAAAVGAAEGAAAGSRHFGRAASELGRGWQERDPRGLLGPAVMLADEARLVAAEAQINADAAAATDARMAADARMATESARAAAHADALRMDADVRADMARADAARISADARIAAEAESAASNIRTNARLAAHHVPLTARGLGLTGGAPLHVLPPHPHPLRAHLPHQQASSALFRSEAVFSAGVVAADAVAETNLLRDVQAREHFRRVEADNAAGMYACKMHRYTWMRACTHTHTHIYIYMYA